MLTLTNIKTSRLPHRVNLTFSDGSFLPFFIDDVVKLSLQKNQEIDDEVKNKIIISSLTYLGREYGLRQIAISPKTEKILSQKLQIFFHRQIKKYLNFSNFQPQKIINQLISEFNQKNLLNQSDFIDSFIAKNKHKSATQIKFLLSQKGVDVSGLKLEKTNDIDSIKHLLTKKKVKKADITDFQSKNKLYSSLFRQGFTISDIKVAIDDYLSLQ